MSALRINMLACVEGVSSIPGFRVVAILIATLLCWRFWRFTVQPRLQPNDVKELPYWLPVIGHALSFFNDAEGTMSRGRLYFGNKRQPFAMTVANDTIYVITSDADVTAVYRKTTELTFESYITDTMTEMGATAQGIERMWQRPNQLKTAGEAEKGFPNPAGKPLAHLSETIFKHQLHPGDQLSSLQNVLLESIEEQMTWPKLLSSGKAILGQDQNGYTVSLLEWVKFVMLKGATTAFFGRKLLEIDPNMLDDFAYFDSHSWKLLYKIPPPWSNAMRAAKKRAQTALVTYFEIPREKRSDACWMVKTLESEMLARGIETKDIGAYLMLMYWVINGNAWKLAFWMLVYLYEDRILFEKVQAEINRLPLSSSDESIGHLETCPTLLAVYHEGLRFCASPVSVRDTSQPTTLGGRILRSGARVVIPYKQMLRDEAIFGQDADCFRPSRFLENDALTKHPSFRPFGGGLTYCPGRFLAKREVLLFVGLAISRFDGRKRQESGPIPQLEEKRPCLGVMSPIDGHDLELTVTKRR